MFQGYIIYIMEIYKYILKWNIFILYWFEILTTFRGLDSSASKPSTLDVCIGIKTRTVNDGISMNFNQKVPTTYQ